jgi:hypothetical protein
MVCHWQDMGHVLLSIYSEVVCASLYSGQWQRYGLSVPDIQATVRVPFQPYTFFNAPDAPQPTGIEVFAALDHGWGVTGLYKYIGGDLQLTNLSIYRVATGPGLAINAATLRRVPVKAMHDAAWQELERARQDDTQFVDPGPLDPAFLGPNTIITAPHGLARLQYETTRAALQAAPRRKELTVVQQGYLEVAATYSRLPSASRADVADALGITPQAVHDGLYGARRWGYLTRPGQGARGGRLTELGAKLAAEYLTRSGRLRKTRKALR